MNAPPRPRAAPDTARIAVTMGDPSGIGPEIVCKALAALPPERRRACVVVGARRFLERAAALTGAGPAFGPDGAAVADVETPHGDRVRDAEATAAGGHAAHGYVARAVEMALAGEVEAIVTAPLNKAALHMAGHRYDGHTELLQHLCGAPSSFMLLASERLSAIHVSTHCSLADAAARVTAARALAAVRIGHAHLRALGVARPRIVCAALDPHCGEGGLFGTRDDSEIAPAVAAAQAEGIDAHGPVAGDVVFRRAMEGAFDLVVANYHDQGHIPIKLIAFDTAVNVTLGLPIARCSVDHGTAFDIAWQGRADPANMLAALAYARRLAAARRRAAR